MRSESPKPGDPPDPPGAATREPVIVGESAALRQVCALARQVAPGDAVVLITGESGVGKDLVARLVHCRSRRAAGPLVAVNCAAVTETLLESELFGHVRGSYTDAVRDTPGKLQLANRGTIFLDEVGEMSLRMQALLLRFLERGEIQPVGSARTESVVDARVVAATNRNLQDAVAAGRFREDLLYRLDVVRIHVPPLRDRREDVRPLVAHLLAGSGRQVTFDEDALRAMETYRWPGNVRELQNVVERVIWTNPPSVVGIANLPSQLRPGSIERVLPVEERRRQRADDLFQALSDGALSFWDHVHTLFLDRDLTRHDLRELVRKGLVATRGNYRAVVTLFGMPQSDYKRFLNFLGTHDCVVDFRPYRGGAASGGAEATPAGPARARRHAPPPGR